jgi:peptide/nickel transport system substrate-binding protein
MIGSRFALAAAFTLAAFASSPAAAQSELRIALQDDPDTLDPATSWSFVGRHVLQSLCDKLLDIDEKGSIVPMLAAAWSWSDDGKELRLKLRTGVTFHDGETFDAEAVRYNLDRALNMPGSRRRAEIDVIGSVEAADAETVRIQLKQPSVPLLAALADRAGMMVSPKAAAAAGADFTPHPVCAGPYRFIEHRAQDRIVLERYLAHWRAAEYAFGRLVYRGMPDSNIRFLNLRSGQLDLIERLAPSDVAAVEADHSLAMTEITSLGYYAITFNMMDDGMANMADVQKRAVRQAFDLAVDREVINRVAFEGRFDAGNQPFPRGSPYYDKDRPVLPRDVPAAKAKLAKAGLDTVTINLLVPNDPQRQQVAQIIQAMVGEVGIKLNIISMELMSLLDRARQGRFEAHLVGWSGRVDPDLNITPLLSCGASGNDGRYCNKQLDGVLAEARATSDANERKAKYKQVIGILLEDLPLIFLYHAKWTFASKAQIKGFKAYPDGIIRLIGVNAVN